MALLFVDSTYDLTLGLLSEDFSWLGLSTYTGKKASAILQQEAHTLLHNRGMRVPDLVGIVTVAGPGFYTGLRLSEGFADIFKFFKVPCYSFYSYEVPRWLGHGEGIWTTKAYRGEYFIHEWNVQGEVNLLLKTSEVGSYLTKQSAKIFIHSEAAIDPAVKGLVPGTQSTLEMIKLSPQKIFKTVMNEKVRRESFYFRAPEDEFRTST